MLKRRHFVLLSGAAALSACGGGTNMPFGPTTRPDDGLFGADPTPDAHLLLTQEGLDPADLADTFIAVRAPASAAQSSMVLQNLPTVAAQGTPTSLGDPGTCEAQSFGYCLGAYTAARTLSGGTKWNAGSATYQPSAAWLYQWEHTVWEKGARSCPMGSEASPYAIKLVNDGSPSTAQVPYNPSGYTTVSQMCAYIDGIDVNQVWPDTANFIIGSYKAFTNIKGQKAQYLDTFRNLMRNGHAIAFSGLVPTGYSAIQPELTDDVYLASQGFIPKSGHGQCIVGFDDHKGANGAFLVQNSFGVAWNAGSSTDPGRNGRVWYDYDAFFAGQNYALYEFPTATEAVSGILLAPSTTGLPEFAIKNVRLRHDTAAGKSRFIVVSHASDALNVLRLTVTDPLGKQHVAKIDEHHRVGFTYVERTDGVVFTPGQYQVAYQVKYRGNAASYTGPVSAPF